MNISNLVSSFLLGSVFIIILFIVTSHWLYIKSILKRFIRIQFRKYFLDPSSQLTEKNIFDLFYKTNLCHLQKINNQLLEKILQTNDSCSFFRDRSISSCLSIQQFRSTIPLTTYEDYRDYIDRIVKNGETNVITSEKIVYFATTSGTTGRSKLIPIVESTVEPGKMLMRIGSSRILMSLSSLFPLSKQRIFQLYSGKKIERFEKTKDGIPIGPLSLYRSAIKSNFLFKQALSTYDVIPFDLLEEMPDFETSAFVQLVFGLSIIDLYSYTVNFAPSFIHSIKIIEKYFDEICLCISTCDFQQSSLIKQNLKDSKLKCKLNEALNELTIEYGGLNYRIERAQYIRKECMKKNSFGLLHRLWPNLIYASTVLGSSFSMYKTEIESYCGDKLHLINLSYYLASEGAFGLIASIYTDEYFLSPAHAFFEFIKEEDILQTQPKTFLISEIEPGNRYELVITTKAGLVRYRMGDVIYCTRLLSRHNDFVPLPCKPIEIPRIPLISMSYRIGSLLNVIGEKTTEEHVLYALQQTILHLKSLGIHNQLSDFASFTKLDAFPVHYVIFFELTDQIPEEKNEMTQINIDLQIEKHLRKANYFYDIMRDAGRLGPLSSILVQNGTFSIFQEKIFATAGVGPLQVKGHRLLRQDDHIQYFYQNKIQL